MTPEALAEAGLRLDVSKDVATVTLDRPDVRNAQTPAMWRALAEVGAALPEDVRVVVVRGTGHSFSAGLDREMLDPGAAPEGVEPVVECSRRRESQIAERSTSTSRASPGCATRGS